MITASPDSRHRAGFVAPAIIGAFVLAGGPSPAQEIPARPEQLQFAPLTFEPPRAADHRRVLDNGVPVYLAPNHRLPLINVVFTFRGGRDLDPPGQVGLVEATAEVIRTGGTLAHSPEEVDQRFEFMAADVSVRVGPTATTASLNCLTPTFADALIQFIEMIAAPALENNRVGLHVAELLERMKQRNDSASAILDREWRALLYGRDHVEAAQMTLPMLKAMTTADLDAAAIRIFHPGNLLIAVSGDFDPDAMMAMLNKLLTGWEPQAPAAAPEAPVAAPRPGLHHIEKDIPQGKVRVGLRTFERDHPDAIPMMIMNEILGGGGFTSRITGRVRDEEGLAYSAGSMHRAPWAYPGEFRASFESKNDTVALALKIVLEEITRIRTEPVSDAELDLAKNAFIETFPRTFESRASTLNVFVEDERTGRDPNHWATYRDRVRIVTVADVQRVARQWLDPDQLAVLVVGRWAEIAPGDAAGRATMADLFGDAITPLPLRDPMTLQPMP